MEKITITFIHERGCSQFQLHKRIKGIFFLLGLVFLGCIFGLFFVLQMNMKEVGGLMIEENRSFAEYSNLHQINKQLENEIEIKTSELKTIHEKISNLESILSTQKNNIQTTSHHELVDVVDLDPSFKDTLLTLIPSQDPVDSFISRNKIASRQYPKRSVHLGYGYKFANKTPILATADGVVELSKRAQGGYGNHVLINHSFGFSSLYAHLVEIKAKRGDFVKKGDVIGYANYFIYYEVLFLNRSVDAKNYVQWDRENFDLVFEDPGVDWGDLLYVVSDILKLRNYGNKPQEEEFKEVMGKASNGPKELKSKEENFSSTNYESVSYLSRIYPLASSVYFSFDARWKNPLLKDYVFLVTPSPSYLDFMMQATHGVSFLQNLKNLSQIAPNSIQNLFPENFQ